MRDRHYPPGKQARASGLSQFCVDTCNFIADAGARAHRITAATHGLIRPACRSVAERHFATKYNSAIECFREIPNLIDRRRLEVWGVLRGKAEPNQSVRSERNREGSVRSALLLHRQPQHPESGVFSSDANQMTGPSACPASRIRG